MITLEPTQNLIIIILVFLPYKAGSNNLTLLGGAAQAPEVEGCGEGIGQPEKCTNSLTLT